MGCVGPSSAEGVTLTIADGGSLKISFSGRFGTGAVTTPISCGCSGISLCFRPAPMYAPAAPHNRQSEVTARPALPPEFALW